MSNSRDFALHCAPINELPYDISTMGYLNLSSDNLSSDGGGAGG